MCAEGGEGTTEHNKIRRQKRLQQGNAAHANLTFRTWGRHSLLLFPLLLQLGLHLRKDGRRVKAAAIKLALKGKEVTDVVLLQGEGRAGGGANVDNGADLFPLLPSVHLSNNGRLSTQEFMNQTQRVDR